MLPAVPHLRALLPLAGELLDSCDAYIHSLLSHLSRHVTVLDERVLRHLEELVHALLVQRRRGLSYLRHRELPLPPTCEPGHRATEQDKNASQWRGDGAQCDQRECLRLP